MTAPLTYSLEAAAERLGGPFTPDWLRGHITEIPHIKVGSGNGRGGRIGFSESDLAEILLMFSVKPAPASKPGDFTPVSRRRAS